MCVGGVDMLVKYYETFKSKQHNLKIATIFSYSANGIYTIDEVDGAYVDMEHINEHSRDKLEAFDEAIALFSNKNAKDVILMQPYEEYVRL
jgi:type I restriction enzyme R subunit